MIGERRWWDALDDAGRERNAWGVPPYDVEAAADLLTMAFAAHPGALLLDLGCGPGRTAFRMAERGYKVEGLDISCEMIGDARKAIEPWRLGRTLDPPRFWIGYGETIPAELPFDHAYSITMFEHIPHEATKSYMKQVHDRLPPGGKFVFTHAPGWDEQTFLHHQCGAWGEPLQWAWGAGFNAGRPLELPPVLEEVGGWMWYLVEKT